MDSTAFRNHGSASGDAAVTLDGQVSRAVVFDGANDYIDCGNDMSLRITNDLTVSAWFKTSAGGSYMAILSDYNGVSPYACEVGQSIDKRMRYMFRGANATAPYLDTAAAYNNGAWRHLAARRTGTTLSILMVMSRLPRGRSETKQRVSTSAAQ